MWNREAAIQCRFGYIKTVMEIKLNSLFLSFNSCGAIISCRPNKIAHLLRLRGVLGWFEIPNNTLVNYRIETHLCMCRLVLVFHSPSNHRNLSVSRKRTIKQCIPFMSYTQKVRLKGFIERTIALNKSNSACFYTPALEVNSIPSTQSANQSSSQSYPHISSEASYARTFA